MTNMMQDKMSCLVKIQIFNAKKNYNVLIACYALATNNKVCEKQNQIPTLPNIWHMKTSL